MTRTPPRHSAKGQPDYEIGYGKPPKHTQFKPGQSGNPNGRPRGQRNLKTVLKEILKERITIREGDRTRTVSRLDAIVRLTINNVLKGDVKALAAFIQLAKPTGLMDEEPVAPGQDAVGADDEAILTGFLSRQSTTQQEDPPGTASPSSANHSKPVKTSAKAKAEDEQ